MTDFHLDDPDDPPAETMTWWKLEHHVIHYSSLRMPDSSSREVKRAAETSQIFQLLKAFIGEAKRHAIECGHGPGSFEAREIFDLAEEVACDVCDPFLPYNWEREMLTAEDVRAKYRITYPHSHRLLFEEARAGRQLEVDRSSFEEGVSSYLRNDFRTPAIDRVLLTALFDMEITSYLRELMEKNIIAGKSAYANFGAGHHPVTLWFIGRLKGILRGVFAFAAVFGALYMEWISEQTAFYLGLAILALYALGTAISIAALFWFIPRWKGVKPRIVDLPEEMRVFYSEVHSAGPLSVKHVRKRTDKLAEMGTLWPGAVWALLDDIEARGIVSLND